jgi:MFS superfamily sulfate permease-like transporter
MPVSISYARSQLNINSGATSKLSSVINGILSLGFGWLFINYYMHSPNIFLQACLLSIELRTCDWAQLLKYWRYDTKSFAVVVITIVTVIFGGNASSIFSGIFTFLLLFTHQFLRPINELMANQSKISSSNYQKTTAVRNHHDRKKAEDQFSKE